MIWPVASLGNSATMRLEIAQLRIAVRGKLLAIDHSETFEFYAMSILR